MEWNVDIIETDIIYQKWLTTEVLNYQNDEYEYGETRHCQSHDERKASDVYDSVDHSKEE